MDYRESAVAGSVLRRTNHIEINVPANGVPTVRFDFETRVVLQDGMSVGTPAGQIVRYFDNPAAEIVIRNTETGRPTGKTSTHGDLYDLIWSLALESAEMKDDEERLAAEAAASHVEIDKFGGEDIL